MLKRQLKYQDYFLVEKQVEALNMKQKYSNLCYEEWAIAMIKVCVYACKVIFVVLEGSWSPVEGEDYHSHRGGDPETRRLPRSHDAAARLYAYREGG